MAAEARRLFVPEYEPEAWAAYPSGSDERVLDDEDALRLLSGAADPFRSDHDHEYVGSIEVQYERDALAPARAVAIGAALASPFWLLVAIILM
jgi:hypothetical protein